MNLTGPFLCSKAVAPIMTQQRQGRSIVYAVTKAALNHLTRCLAVALAPDVLVNCVAPGFMEGTRMSGNLAPEYQRRARQDSLLHRAVSKDDVAEAVVELCRTDSITGQTLVIDAGRMFR